MSIHPPPKATRVTESLDVAEVAKMTPSSRNRVVDLMRVLALLIVVLGHWVMQGVYVDRADNLHRLGLLDLATWAHPLTWILQVMPIFFLVGGYSNALSWRRAQTRGTTYGAWLHRRAGRLSRPLLPLLVFWAVVAPTIGTLGFGHDWLRIAGKASLVPTWFLAVYLVVVALVPLSLALWDRWRFVSLGPGLGLAAIVDILSIHFESDVIGAVNLLFVWVTMHQLGYAWLDGTLHGNLRPQLLAVSGFIGVVTLVAFGPYGVSMVGVSGFGVDNASPPRITLLLLGVWQAGIAISLEPYLRRILERPLIWFVVVVLE